MKRRSSRKSYESTLVNEEEDYIANTYHSPKPMLSIDAKIFPILHSICLIVGFFLPLLIACRYHFKSVVKNQFHSYPKEYVPTVSAVVGDWFPERNIFDLAMAAVCHSIYINEFLRLLSRDLFYLFWLMLNQRITKVWPFLVSFELYLPVCGFTFHREITIRFTRFLLLRMLSHPFFICLLAHQWFLKPNTLKQDLRGLW